ncbi:sensor domain-containing diguanylate cyclase [Legionella septentrionalis]|uniref:sensor domain-containing diguanylate cyclase n=1 Tax=Legionella septentrionalis TaxID=2498109 RepID=UPI000F8C7F4A|nr:diguanylate cyclase [Legionella septentrionalis]RUR09194.1 diguanylate cyclase [Legionella septentrionalis]
MHEDMNKRVSSVLGLKKMRLGKSVFNLIFILTFFLLILLTIASYNQIKNLFAESHRVIHTHEVIETLDLALFEVVDIESHQRGYLITGQELFLTDLDGRKARLNNILEKLKNLTADHPPQQERVMLFSDSVKERLDVLSKLLHIKVANKLATTEGTDLLNHSQAASVKVKSLGQEIKSIEYILLKARNDTVMQRAYRASIILAVGSFLAIASLLFAAFLVRQELLRRKAIEEKNKNTENRLRKIIESSRDMIAAFNEQQEFIIFNERYAREFKRIFGKKVHVGLSLKEALLHISEDKRKIAALFEDSLTLEILDKRFECSEGEEKRIYELTSSPIEGEESSYQGTLQTLRDITKQMEEHTALQQSYEQLTIGIKALENKNKQITLLVEMSDIMLACSSVDELREVMANYSKQLLDFASGYLFIMHPSKNYLEEIMSWGNPIPQKTTFSPDDCWGIRLGRIHQVDEKHPGLICQHLEMEEHQHHATLCVPLMAQNDIYGMLYLESATKESLFADEDKKLLIIAFAELTALALANVRLRENLRHQSIRDPLTGLYNRRYLEDFLFKLINQAQRTESPLSLLMLDLDHFKKINDTFGHDAGDAALKEVGKILQSAIREGDIASRYGGEEFLILFYDIDLESTRNRAKALREEISSLKIKYGAEQIGPFTVSIGIAAFPIDGTTPEQLIEAADKALYYAKNHGRNQEVLFCELDLQRPS